MPSSKPSLPFGFAWLAILLSNSAAALTIDELLAAEARPQRETVAAPSQQYIPPTPTFEVQAIFGLDGQVQADVSYDGITSRVGVGDSVGPCVVAQIAGSLGTGVRLQPKVAPGTDTGKGKGKGKAKASNQPSTGERCHTAHWTAPQAASQSATTAEPLIPRNDRHPPWHARPYPIFNTRKKTSLKINNLQRTRFQSLIFSVFFRVKPPVS